MKLQGIHVRDPFILVDDGKYYLYGTRGKDCWTDASGFDVYISTDLMNWSDPIPVFEKSNDFWADQQFWAPEVHKHNDKFYMFASFKSADHCRATHILVSDKPNGMFVPVNSEPATPAEWECLDGTFYIDKAGIPYIVFFHEWVQVSNGEIWAQQLTADLKGTIGTPTLLFKASSPS